MFAKALLFSKTGALSTLALLVAAGACQNQFQAPEAQGPEGAALNVGLGAAVAPLHRAATGCYTPCAYGTVCDEPSGTCVSRECAPTEPGCGGPVPPGPRAPASPGSPAPPPTVPIPEVRTPVLTEGVTPICVPDCIGQQVCVVVEGSPACRLPSTGAAAVPPSEPVGVVPGPVPVPPVPAR